MKPILFNTEMVRAILEKTKTMTRRAIKNIGNDLMYFQDTWSDGKQQACFMGGKEPVYVNYPYGIGDILYVRETWKVGTWTNGCMKVAIDYKAGRHEKTDWINTFGNHNKLLEQNIEDCRKAKLINVESGMTYQEECDKGLLFDEQYKWEVGDSPCRWRPSIHMPKKYARIFLIVTDVRVERLQDISDEDCIAEGITWHPPIGHNDPTDDVTEKEVFQGLWNSTAKDGYKWEDNPYVFVYEFERVEK